MFAQYENLRRVRYEGGATFVPVCDRCGRFVKPDAVIFVSEGAGLSPDPNATCKRCGPARMVFEGFIEEDKP